MRILHLNPFYLPYAGGIERRIHELAQRHAAGGHDVHILTAQLPQSHGPTPPHDAATVHRLPSRFRLDALYNPPLVSTLHLEETIRRIRPDVIDLHSRWSPTYMRAFLRSDARRVFTYHNTFGEGTGLLRPLSLLNDLLTRRSIRRSHRIIAISRFLQTDLARHKFPTARVRVAPNGIDAPALRALAPDPTPGPRLLVTTGRVVAIKGFDTAIRALPRLPEYHLLICGDGPDRARLARLARRLGVGDRVRLPGWVPEAEKLQALRSSFAYVQPSRFEAFGIAALEALAMGAPIVASDVGGLPEVVGDAGLLVPPNRPDLLAEAVRSLEQPGARDAVTRHAAAQAARYSWDRAASATLAVYEEALESPKV